MEYFVLFLFVTYTHSLARALSPPSLLHGAESTSRKAAESSASPQFSPSSQPAEGATTPLSAASFQVQVARAREEEVELVRQFCNKPTPVPDPSVDESFVCLLVSDYKL